MTATIVNAVTSDNNNSNGILTAAKEHLFNTHMLDQVPRTAKLHFSNSD